MSQANRLLSKRTFQRPVFRFTHSHLRVVKAIAGSLFLHTLAVAMGGAIALQTSKPKIDTQFLPFKWEVSLITAPAFESVTSDVPTHTLSAPPQEQQNLPSESFQHGTFADPPNPSIQPKKARNLKSSQKQAVPPNQNEPLTGGQPIPSRSSGDHTSMPPSGKSASRSQREKREMILPRDIGHRVKIYNDSK